MGRFSARSRDSGLSTWTVLAALAVGVSCSSLAAWTVLKRKKHQARREQKAKQWTRREDFNKENGFKEASPSRNHAPLMHGLRVIEATFEISGTSLGRILADCGAEVIKLEEPGKRRDSEQLNVGKYSVCFGEKIELSHHHVYKLLQDADVLIASSSFYSSDIFEAFPHVVFVEIPDDELDGCFFAGSGFAGLLHNEKTRSYHRQAPHFGSLMAAQVLLSGVCLALISRLESGLGRRVTTSLAHCGVFCVAPYLLRHPYKEQTKSPKILVPLYKNRARRDPWRTVYRTKDGEHIAVVGFVSDFIIPREIDMLGALKRAFCLHPTTTISDLYSEMKAKISSLSLESTVRICSTNGVAFVCVRKDPVKTTEESFLGRPSISSKRLVQLPYSFSSAPLHEPKKSVAAVVGEDTECVIEQGWFSRNSACQLPKASTQGVSCRLPLQGITILELCEFTHVDITVPACTSILLDQGATVIRVEVGKDALKEYSQTLYQHYTMGKAILRLKDLATQGNSILQDKLKTVDVFVTNIQREKLFHYDLDSSSLATRCPKLIVVNLFAYRGKKQNHFCLGGLYCSTNVSSCFSSDKVVPNPPLHTLELMSASYLAAGLSMSLFHMKRTRCDYTSVEVCYDAIGNYMCQLVPGWPLEPDFPEENLFYRTKDGIWVQLYEPDMLYRTFRALGVTLSGHLRLSWMKVLSLHKENGSAVVQETLNYILKEAFGRISFRDFSSQAKYHGVKFTPVLMPQQLLYSKAHQRGDIFETTNHGNSLKVTSPLSLV